jgi:MtN3 and saliva related transmembrane protein
MTLKDWLLEHKEAVGYAAILFCSLSYFPQIARIRKNKSSKDVSFLMFASWITGSCIWLCYGIMERLMPIILTNAINLTFRLWVLGTKVVMDHRNGRIKLSFLNRFIRPVK